MATASLTTKPSSLHSPSTLVASRGLGQPLSKVRVALGLAVRGLGGLDVRHGHVLLAAGLLGPALLAVHGTPGGHLGPGVEDAEDAEDAEVDLAGGLDGVEVLVVELGEAQSALLPFMAAW